MKRRNTVWEIYETYTIFNSQIDQEEERISESEDQLNEIQQEYKIREKRIKNMKKASKKYGIM